MKKSEFSCNFLHNKQYIDKLFHVDKSFDTIYRVLQIGGRSACFYFIDGLCNDDVMERVMEFLYLIDEEEMPNTAHEFLKQEMPYGEIDLVATEANLIQRFLSGVPILIVEGYNEFLAIDFRTYPIRSVAEPETDRVMRGSRDGFVETIVFNTALIRRRVRTPDLVMEMHTVGRSSRTDVVISYLGDRVEQKLLDMIRKKIDDIDIDSLTMNQQSLAECLFKHKWFNPFPKFNFSERPDATAAAIFEGSIVILVDNSPSVIILPVSIFDIMEDADDYYFPPITGTYLRFTRFFINIIAVVLTPTFLLLINNQQWIPSWLQFIKIKEAVNVSLLIQFLILEFGIDGLKMASVNTPSMLSMPLSIVAGIVLGDYTVSSGWFNSEIMLYMAFVAVSNYSQISIEVGYALKFMRLILLCLTSFFSIYGYIGGLAFILLCIVFNKTIAGSSYIYPLIPFNRQQFLRRFCRVSLPKSEKMQKGS